MSVHGRWRALRMTRVLPGAGLGVACWHTFWSQSLVTKYALYGVVSDMNWELSLLFLWLLTAEGHSSGETFEGKNTSNIIQSFSLWVPAMHPSSMGSALSLEDFGYLWTQMTTFEDVWKSANSTTSEGPGTIPTAEGPMVNQTQGPCSPRVHSTGQREKAN